MKEAATFEKYKVGLSPRILGIQSEEAYQHSLFTLVVAGERGMEKGARNEKEFELCRLVDFLWLGARGGGNWRSVGKVNSESSLRGGGDEPTRRRGKEGGATGRRRGPSNGHAPS